MTEPVAVANWVQLPLDLAYRPALGRDAFWVAGSNEAAVAWIDRWPDWPGHALVVEGPPGSGKTHLASVWQARSGAFAIAGGELAWRAIPDLVDSHPALVIEAAPAAPEAALFHLYNAMAEAGRSLLLIAEQPPARWTIALPDLASRLRSVPVAGIQRPDEQLLVAVLRKLFADRQLPVTDDVIAFIVTRIERSFDSARRVAAAIDRAALAQRRKVTQRLVRDVLQTPPAPE